MTTTLNARPSYLPALPDLRGKGAIHAASAHGAPLYVLNAQSGWLVADTGTLGRIARLQQCDGEDADLWNYGADSSAVSRAQHCAACWHRPYGNLVQGYGSKPDHVAPPSADRFAPTGHRWNRED